jgi:hypothetical protein
MAKRFANPAGDIGFGTRLQALNSLLERNFGFNRHPAGNGFFYLLNTT